MTGSSGKRESKLKSTKTALTRFIFSAAGATVDQMASVLRDMGAPSVKMVDTAEMTLHSYGLESGLVIETGYEATFVVPIWNGRSISSAIQKIDIAGDDITS